ncbi:MAG: hypothetical protein LBM08_06380 [Dysgonamonadaceae bacterium]|jgi:hypothetical protein|nr:hypothetical protein [Dysgonamonadaceae bacterium]
MKRILFMTAVCAVLIAGCGKDDPKIPDEITDEVIAELLTLYADQTGGSISFNAPEDWEIEIAELVSASSETAVTKFTPEPVEVIGNPNWIWMPVRDGVSGMWTLVYEMQPNYLGYRRTARVRVNTSSEQRTLFEFNLTQLGETMDGKPLEKKYDVYLAGFLDLEAGELGYWKNGEKIYLSNAYGHNTNNNVTGMAVLGNDVYASGYIMEADNNMRAVYWKNGEMVKLPKTLQNSYATAITVVQEPDLNGKPVVYVAGSESSYDSESGKTTTVMQYWKDGVAYQITSVPNNVTRFIDIAVHGNDVHLIGNTNPSSQRISSPSYYAYYWKNGVRTDLQTGGNDEAEIKDLAVAPNGDVYIVGCKISGRKQQFVSGFGTVYSLDKVTAVVWKNGVMSKMEDSVESICFDGNDVYIAAAPGNSNGVYYYKNGEKTYVGSTGSMYSTYLGKNSITVVDGDVYVRAYAIAEGYLMFWKNGTKYQISDGRDMTNPTQISTSVYVGDIIVVPHSPTRTW